MSSKLPNQLALFDGARRRNASRTWVEEATATAMVAAARKAVKPIELGWLAGIIDGEGTVTAIARKDACVAFVCVSNTNLRLLDRVREIAGKMTSYEGQFRIGQKHRARHWKPIYRVEWSCRAALVLLKCIEPYLVIKREQAKIAIELQTRVTGRYGGYARWNKLSEDEKRYRKDVMRELHRLNRRGRTLMEED